VNRVAWPSVEDEDDHAERTGSLFCSEHAAGVLRLPHCRPLGSVRLDERGVPGRSGPSAPGGSSRQFVNKPEALHRRGAEEEDDKGYDTGYRRGEGPREFCPTGWAKLWEDFEEGTPGGGMS
jgi:hypothetical protein